MRTIKFRGYTKETADTYRTVEFDLEDLMIGTHDIRTVDLKFWKVVQFTGFLDKNGKEIYEGDVFKPRNGSPNPCEVVWEVSLGVGLRDSAGAWQGKLAHQAIEGEVIGNIYEHAVRTSDWEDKSKPDYCLDYKHQGYSLDEIMNEEWFAPVGKLTEFIPAFPSPRKIEEYVYLTFETRLVNDVDECRALNDLFEDGVFQANLYDFVKAEYERHHNLPNTPTPVG